MLNFGAKVGSTMLPLDDYRETADIRRKMSSVEFVIGIDTLETRNISYDELLSLLTTNAAVIQLVDTRSGNKVFEYPGYAIAEAGRRIEYSNGEISIFIRLERPL